MDTVTRPDPLAERLADPTPLTAEGFTYAQLRAAFEAVEQPGDWKGPISARMSGGCVTLAVRAIQFFTATTPRVTLDVGSMEYLVESEGYRAGPAGP